MEKSKWILLGILALQFLINDATSQSTVPPGETQVTGQADPGANAPESDATGGSASQRGTSQSDAAENNEGENVANTPAVPQLTTSGSGSPAVLSGENGKNRDGTNNVQRATMNMAGAPAGSIDLAENTANTHEAAIKERQREQRNQESVRQQSDKTANIPGNAAERESRNIGDNSRKENNALSDQNLSSKKAGKNGKKDEKTKEKKRDNSK